MNHATATKVGQIFRPVALADCQSEPFTAPDVVRKRAEILGR